MFDKLLLKAIKDIIREYKLTTHIKMSRLVDGKRKPYTKKELANELHKHLEIMEDGEIKYKQHLPMTVRYKQPEKKIPTKELIVKTEKKIEKINIDVLNEKNRKKIQKEEELKKLQEKKPTPTTVVKPEQKTKIINWEEIVSDKTTKKLPYIQGNILGKFLKSLTAKQIFNLLNNINKNTWLLNEDFLGNKNKTKLKKNRYKYVIEYLITKKLTSFDEIYAELKSEVIKTLPKKKIQLYKDYIKGYWEKKNIDEPIIK